MDTVVVHDEHVALGGPIGSTQLVEQPDEQQRAFAFPLDTHYPTGVSMKSAGDIALLISARDV